MIVADYLAAAAAKLKQAGVDHALFDVRLLACHALKMDRAQLLGRAQQNLTEAEILSLDALIMRRVAREPVARILGSREFWGLEFGLNEATLEPRPDSETIIETVLRLRQNPLRILDIGTGTGCLLLALLHEFPQATGLGIDISPRAVEQAKLNAEALGMAQRATFKAGSWLTGITEKFDIIVSNPPYVPSPDLAGLMPEVRDHDPALALDGGADGLAPYRLLIPQLPGFLNPQGLVTFEVGIGQASQVVAMFRKQGFIDIAVHKDLGGIDRCVTASLSTYIS